jgi:hypothetical protein
MKNCLGNDMKKKLRSSIKLPFYWETFFINLQDEEVGRLFQAIMDYGFFGIEPTREALHGAEWAVWPTIKRDLDWQFTHKRAFCYPKDDNMAIRNSPEYREWRNSVFERDCYTCQICHKQGGRLNAHHIKRFAKYPELRLSLQNGITLCYECHHAVHRGEIECPTEF